MVKEKIALIPAYEPDKIMLGLLEELKKQGYSIVVVDDGSGIIWRPIFQQAEQYGIVLQHMENRGKGAALKTGFRYINKHFDANSIVVTLDADGQHKIEDVNRVVLAAQREPHSLILGSRALEKNVPLRSRLGNTITRAVYRLITGIKVHDTQTGLRAFSVEMIPIFLEIEGERYEYEMNVLLQSKQRNIWLKEVTIETVYLNGNQSSHFNTLKDSVRIYREILKFSLSSFISFLIDYGLYSLFSIVVNVWAITNGLIVANVCARIISATVNYNLNRKKVFKSDTGLLRSALQYTLLAAGILVINTFLLTELVALGVNQFLAKILVEIVLFTVNFTIQKKWIFPLKNKIKENEVNYYEKI